MDRLQHQLTAGVLALAALAGTGCDRPSPGRASYAGVVDSVVPREVALERFRAGRTAPAGLDDGAPNRDALVQAFVRALEVSDTTSLVRLALTRAEFAWLYYPTNPQSLPPYDLSPQLMWFLLESHHRRGMERLLAQRAGHPLHYAGYSCEPTASHEGDNVAWGPCVVRRIQAPGDTVDERLFGLILERGGRFKFVSYANKLD